MNLFGDLRPVCGASCLWLDSETAPVLLPMHISLCSPMSVAFLVARHCASSVARRLAAAAGASWVARRWAVASALEALATLRVVAVAAGQLPAVAAAACCGARVAVA